MASYDYDVGIPGGVAAGLTVAAGRPRRQDPVDREGGQARRRLPALRLRALQILIRSAGVWALARRAAEFGLPALPPVADLAGVAHWTNENMFQERTLPRRLLVLGGGADRPGESASDQPR